MDDPTQLQDKILLMREEVARLRSMHKEEVHHVAQARNENEQANEQYEMSSASISLADVSSRALVSGKKVETRIDRDNRLLKHSTDTIEIAERVLELQLLDREHDRSVQDSKQCANEWKQRLAKATDRVQELQDTLKNIPSSERGDLVDATEKYTLLNTKKRRLISDMADETRAHQEIKHTKEEHIQNMQETLARLDVQVGQAKSDTRKIEREQASHEARIESLEEQREDYRSRLQQYSNDESLLRVSFKRYDTDMSGSLDAAEIFQATQEILAISNDNDVEFTMEDAQAQIDAFDKDGNGSLDFKEYKRGTKSLKCTFDLMCVESNNF